MLADSHGKNVVKLGRHKLILGWFSLGEGFSHFQLGTILYKGIAVWEYELYLGVLGVYIRWERPI